MAAGAKAATREAAREAASPGARAAAGLAAGVAAGVAAGPAALRAASRKQAAVTAGPVASPGDQVRLTGRNGATRRSCMRDTNQLPAFFHTVPRCWAAHDGVLLLAHLRLALHVDAEAASQVAGWAGARQAGRADTGLRVGSRRRCHRCACHVRWRRYGRGCQRTPVAAERQKGALQHTCAQQAGVACQAGSDQGACSAMLSGQRRGRQAWAAPHAHHTSWAHQCSLLSSLQPQAPLTARACCRAQPMPCCGKPQAVSWARPAPARVSCGTLKASPVRHSAVSPLGCAAGSASRPASEAAGPAGAGAGAAAVVSCAQGLG